jgi:glycine oxidase
VRVVVIGGGIVGLSIAWRLTRARAHVVVCDPAPASGATHAAAGMLAPVAETYHREQELGALCLASSQAYAGFVAELAEDTDGVPIGYETGGTLICGTDAADRQALTDLHHLASSLGLDSRQLTTREARRLEPLLGPGLACAFLAPKDHQVDPRAMATALLAALDRRGGRVVPEAVTAVTHRDADDPASPVTGVLLASGCVVAADAVVIANAVAAGDLTGLPVDLQPMLRPVHGDVVRLTPPPHLRGLLTRTIRGYAAGHPAYLVPRADGTVVLGATSREDGNPDVSAGGVHTLLRDAIRLVPVVAEFAIAETIARPRPGTPDNAPLLGPLGAPGLVVATGFFRHGVLLAPAAGIIAARLIGLDDDLAAPDLTTRPAFDPCRFLPQRSAFGHEHEHEHERIRT